MKNFTLLKSFQFLTILILFFGCAKDSVETSIPPKIEEPVKPKPSPDTVVVPEKPVEAVKYPYMLVNVSSDTIYIFNNNAKTPKENFQEIMLLPRAEVMVKVESDKGITPMVRTNNPALQTEIEIDPGSDGKIYIFNAFLYEINFLISGTCEAVNLSFPNPQTGQLENLIDTTLPRSINFKKAPDEIKLIAEKQRVTGSLLLTVYYKGKSIYTKTTSAAFGKITASAKSKSVSSEVSEPEEWPCGTHNGNRLITGKRGGCYYINKNGNKTYVDRSECQCN